MSIIDISLKTERMTRLDTALNWIRILLAGLLAVWPLYMAVLHLAGRYAPDPVDFGAYYHAAVRYQEGYSLYALSTSIPQLADAYASNMAYLYSPVAVLPFIPFTLLPVRAAAAVWNVGGYLYLYGSLLLLVRSLGVTLSRRQKLLAGWLLIGYAPVLYSLYLGQVTAYLVGTICLVGAALERAYTAPEDSHWQYLAGALLPFVVAVKPYYAAAGAAFVRDRRRVTGALVSLTVLGVSTVLLFDPATLGGYLNVLQGGKGWGETVIPPIQWETGIYRPLYVLGEFRLEARLFWAAGVAILSAYSAVLFHGRYSDRYVFALGVLSISVILPEPNPLALVTPLPALVVLYVTEQRRDGALQLIPLFALGCYQTHDLFIQVVGKYLPSGSMLTEVVINLLPVIQPGLWGTIVLTGLILYRFRTDYRLQAAVTVNARGN